LPRPTRRETLAGAALVGCAAPFVADAPEDQSYDRLHGTAVYVAPEVALSVPAVGATNNADLLVLPGDTADGPEQTVDWLAADRVIALLGDGAERRWLEWAGSDPFVDTFETQGAADAEPDPTLVVGAAIGLDVTTDRHTWSHGPRDRDVLRALDEALVDVAATTPR
jgi:hypothetical protein